MLLKMLDATDHEVLVIASLVRGTRPNDRLDLKPGST
jgi:hypothetical protein